MTPAHVAQVLWSDAEHKQFYVIPTEVTLPLGPLELRSMTGGLRSVQPKATASYAITEPTARRMMKWAITGVMQHASDTLRDLGVLLAVYGKAAQQPLETLDPAPRAEARAARLAALLELPLEDARDPGVVRDRLGTLVQEVEDELRHKDIFDPQADTEAFRQRLHQVLAGAFEQVGAEHDEVATTMPLALRQALQDHDLQAEVRTLNALLEHAAELAEDAADLE